MKNIDNLNALIHDLNNTLFSISGLLVNGNIKGAKEKILKVFGPLDNNEIRNLTPIELLIRSKTNLMIKHNITFSFQNLEFPKIDDAYLCIIFGNILDNAINFSLQSEVKSISVKYKKTKKFYIYTISNYFLYNKNNNSSSRQKIGIKSVRRILNKIGGKAIFEIKNNKFFAKIFFPTNF